MQKLDLRLKIQIEVLMSKVKVTRQRLGHTKYVLKLGKEPVYD